MMTMLLFGCFYYITLLSELSECNEIHHVSDEYQLKRALNSVKPGDTIELADGTYYSELSFVANISGTSDAKIIMKGSNKAVISNTEYHHCFNLTASHWVLRVSKEIIQEKVSIFILILILT